MFVKEQINDKNVSIENILLSPLKNTQTSLLFPSFYYAYLYNCNILGVVHLLFLLIPKKEQI